MADKPLFILAAIAVLVVIVILAIGIGGFAVGGEYNRRNGNKMMRWRLIAQAIAIIVILGFVALRGSHWSF